MSASLFASRSNWPNEANAITVLWEDFKKRGVRVIDLTQSNPTVVGFRYSASKVLKLLSHKNNLRYEPTAQGSLPAREAVSRYYKTKGLTVDPKRIFLTSSTSEGYSFIFKFLVNPGESVLFPKPSYPLFDMLCQVNDVVMGHYGLVYENNNWRIAEEQMHPGKNVKAIALVNPNNPTGSYVSREEGLFLNAVCEENKLALISDEVFFDFNLEKGLKPYSFVENADVLTFVLGGISKAAGLPQMKASWVVINGPDALVKDAQFRLEMIADTYLSVSTPAQTALLAWLEHCDKIQKQIRQRLEANYAQLRAMLRNNNDLSVCHTQGGWYAVLRINKDISEDELAMALLEKDRVFVHPGYFFDFEEGNFLILSLLTAPAAFKEGLAKLINRVSVT